MIRISVLSKANLIDPPARQLFEEELNALEKKCIDYSFICSHNVLLCDEGLVVATVVAKVDPMHKVMMPVTEDQWKKAERLAATR